MKANNMITKFKKRKRERNGKKFSYEIVWRKDELPIRQRNNEKDVGNSRHKLTRL